MNEEQRRVLEMVQAGTISPEEADRLLAALEAAATAAPQAVPQTATPAPMTYRRYWEIPFGVGLLLLGVSGVCISLVSATLLVFCGWIAFVSAGAVALLGWWSRSARWVHVRIREQDGGRIAFSLPLPFGVAAWGIGFARRFVDDETAENLELARSLLDMVKDTPPGEPLSVEIDDEDGDHVQVYLG